MLIGGAGTGKTTTLRVLEALAEYFHGSGSFCKSAPTNTAARLLGGDTVHALYKLPRSTLASRRGRLSGRVLKRFRRQWSPVLAQAIDEISVVPPDILYQINERSREGKQNWGACMGGLATILSGDFLQLPPVNRPSLAQRLDTEGFAVEEEEEAERVAAKTKDAQLVKKRKRGGSQAEDQAMNEETTQKKQRVEAEIRGGREIYLEEFKSVTYLTRNMRTTGLLRHILDGMRDRCISDALWNALEDTQIGWIRENGVLRRLPDGVEDPRLQQPPFSDNFVTYVVHRHSLRATQSYHNAVRESCRRNTRLYLSVASDVVRDGNATQLTDEVRRALLEIHNPRDVKHLPGVLVLYRTMRLLLYRKICVRLGLVHGAECVLEDIVFAEEEDLPEWCYAGTPIVLSFLPVRLLLRAVDVPWVLPASQLPPLAPDVDRRGLFLLGPHTDYFQYELGAGEGLTIRRTHFSVLPADTRVVYSAQGEGFKASVADMAKPPLMSPEVHWLANYVMVSRATDLSGFLTLRLPRREDLTRGAPKYLVDEMDRLLQLEKSGVYHLRKRLTKLSASLPKPTLDVLEELFLYNDVGKANYNMAPAASEGDSVASKPVNRAPSGNSLAQTPLRRRITGKQSVDVGVGADAESTADAKRDRQTTAADTRAEAAAHRGIGDLATVEQMRRRAAARKRLDDMERRGRVSSSGSTEAAMQNAHGAGSAAASSSSTTPTTATTSIDLTATAGPQRLYGVGGASHPNVAAGAAASADAVSSPSHDAPELPIHEPPANSELLDALTLDAPGLLGYASEGDVYVDPAQAALHNPRNMCYLNAVLHVLARTPSIRNWAVHHLALCPGSQGAQTCFLCDLGTDLRRLSIDDDAVPQVACIVRSRGAWSRGAFASSNQQDAHEALGCLLDACEAVDWNMLLALPLPVEVSAALARNGGSNADRYSTPFRRALGGLQQSTVTCKACRSTSARLDMWHSLSLSLPERPCTIEQLVSNYFESAPLPDETDRCLHERCLVRNRREKADQLIRWPAVLMVHLKRWKVVSTHPFTQRKVPTSVQYETMFVVDASQPAYHLRGVVEHHGDAGGGHYTSMVRAPDNFWYFCDDGSSPRRVPTASALKAQAMILVYERT